MAEKSIETSKKLAAQRQIEAAILHYQAGQYECAVTLAHAGENVAGHGAKNFFQALKEKMFDTDHNQFANWLKHPSGAPTATLLEMEVLAMIQRGISNYNAVYGGVTQQMGKFMSEMRSRFKVDSGKRGGKSV